VPDRVVLEGTEAGRVAEGGVEVGGVEALSE
jgi:hypothetical protein